MNAQNSSRIGFLPTLALLLVVAGPLASARAQSVVSLNALGYVDVNFPAGSNLVANPLFAADNRVSNLFRDLPSGSYFLPWDQGGGTFGPTNRYTSSNGWTTPHATFLAPDGGFLWLPTATKISFVGQPWGLIPGPGCLTYPIGETVLGWLPTRACGICILPENCPPMFSDGLSVVTWNPQTQAYNDAQTYFEGFGWVPSEPSLGPAQSARIISQQTLSARSPFLGSLLGGGPGPQGLLSLTLTSPQRDGTNLTFQWSGTNTINYAVFCSTNLHEVSWQFVQQGTATPSNGVSTVTVAGTNSRAFYRVLPDFSATPAPVLLGGIRSSTDFGFQFYAPLATNYVVERSPTFPVPAWQLVTNVATGPSNIVAVVDHGATASSGYYRVRY